MGARDLLADAAEAGLTIAADGDHLVISPASRLTQTMRDALRQAKPELLALLREALPAPAKAANQEAAHALAGADSPARPEVKPLQTCAGCRHHGQHSTCLSPVAAGLLTQAEGFGIVWPSPTHPATCPAFTDKVPNKATARPFKLTLVQGNAAHADEWDDACIARFQDRAHRVARLGFAGNIADDLAEQLHLRDVTGDDRSLCVECGHFRRGHCGNHRAAGLRSPELSDELATTMHRCSGRSV